MRTATKSNGRQRAVNPCELVNCDPDALVAKNAKRGRPANLAREEMLVMLLLPNGSEPSDPVGSFEVIDHSGKGCERLYARLVRAAREHVEESKSPQGNADPEATEQPTIRPDKMVPIGIRFTADGHELATVTFDGDAGDARHLLKEFERWFEGHITNTVTCRLVYSLERADEACDRLFGEAVTV